MLGRDQKSFGVRGPRSRQLKFESLEERVVLASQGLTAEPPLAAAFAPTTPPIAAAQTIEEWVHSLTFTQFNLLAPDQVQYLTTQQVASIPEIYWFSQMSGSARAALSMPQVQSLKVSTVHLDYLTPQQVSWLTVAQIQSLSVQDFKFLGASQTPSLTTAQVAAIPDPGPFADWTPAARAALTQPQIQSLNVGQVWLTLLTDQQVGWLTVPQIQSLRIADLYRLNAIQTPFLTTAQIAGIPDPGPFSQWTPAARAALTQPQIQALKVRDVRITLLTPTQILWLTVPQVQSLLAYDFVYLPPSQIPNLTPAQIATIPGASTLSAWSAAARAALTSPQVQALNVGVIGLDLLTPVQVGYLTASQVQSLNVGVIGLSLLSPVQVAYLTATQVATLQLSDFKLLPASHVPYLTPAQIATIPDPGPLSEWTPEARAALTQPQVQALKVRDVRITMLTPTQLTWLTAAQVQSLQQNDFAYLPPSQIPNLTPAQIATIPDPGPFADWTPAARAALTQPQIQALNVGQVWLTLLTDQQVGWLTVPQIQSLRIADLYRLNASQTPFLTTAQIAGIPDPGPFSQWTPAARAALTQPQIQALNVGQVWLTLLTDQQVGWLTVPQIQSLRIADLYRLNASQTPFLTTAQIAGIPDAGPLSAWSAAARAALTSPQVQALNVGVIGLSMLTPVQVGYLTPSQVQTLNVGLIGLSLLSSAQVASLTAAQVRTLQLQDFKYLPASHVPYLTPAQIATIPDPGPLSEWTPEARAALTQPQVQALKVRDVRITMLTPTQLTWLTAAQVQSLQQNDFAYLPPSQIPNLTPAQIATIPDPGPFSQWTVAARAALTLPQVQALKVRDVRITMLTPTQLTWLTVAQVQSLQLNDFSYLPPSQVPNLSLSQIASIPDPGPLSAWTPEARAALTLPQVQALNVRDVRITQLTSQQTAWLTAAQVQSLYNNDFEFLPASQIPNLSLVQIASIADQASFAKLNAAARAALTPLQVQSVNVRDVHLTLLTAAQIALLTAAQIQSLNYIDFPLLAVSQIPLIAPAQFAAVQSGFFLRDYLSDAAQAQLSRAQILGMSPKAYGEYMTALTPPSNYTPAVNVPVGPDGIAINHTVHDEAERVTNLVPLAAATHVTIGSGDWSNPAIWQGGQLPTAGSRVVITAGTIVRFNIFMSTAQAVKTLRIDGALAFSTNTTTKLTADTIVVMPTGKLYIGTSAQPIASNVSASIVIPDGGPIDTVWDPYLLSRGIISQGEVRMFGKAVAPYVALDQAPRAGATQLVLTQIPANWSVGNKILITGTDQFDLGNHDEERTIRAIFGNTVVVDALQYDHVPPAGFGLSVYAANFTRNIVISSAVNDVPAERPHMMFMHNPNVQIDNISVIGFGRTDKTKPINDPVVVDGVLQPGTGTNPRARYAIHFHHTGVNPGYAPAMVRGSVVLGSPGWGFVNHSSSVLMEYNISYQVVGAGFVTEDGNEIGWMRGNLAIESTGSGAQLQSRSGIHDFGHGGSGFWLQGPGVEMYDNIAVGQADAAFVIFTTSTKDLYDAVNLKDPSLAAGKAAIPVGAAPLRAFSGNIAATSKTGLEIWFHNTLMPDGETYIDNFKSWNTRNNGIELHYVGQTTIRNATLVGNMYEFNGVGIFTNHIESDITLQNNRIEGFEKGIIAPPRRTNDIIGGIFNDVIGIYVTGANDTVRTLNIGGALTFKNPTSTQLKGRQPYTFYMDGQLDFVHRRLEEAIAPDHIRFVQNNVVVAVAYFFEQAADYVPFKANEARGYVPDQYLDLTNAQLRAQFGVSFGGGLPPADVTIPPTYFAFIDSTP